MATLLHFLWQFLWSLAVTLLAGFLLSICALGSLLGGLLVLQESPAASIAQPCYIQVSRFLAVFGGGDRLEGIVVIALTIGVVTALLGGFSAYKRSQRSEWHLAMSNVTKD